MLALPEKEVSYWMDSSPEYLLYPKLEDDLTVDVAIIGAGIAGLSTAYFLKQAGYSVAVIEKNVVGGGVTGFTTGKVSSQHGLKYSKLQKRIGKEKARLYGEANQAAIGAIEDIITREKIDCDWRREDNVVFTDKQAELDVLKAEAAVAAKLGLPARFTSETALPFSVKGAVIFSDQATFHPRKYLLGLAKAVNGEGSYVFEQTKATHIDHGPPGAVHTKKGHVHAEHIVIATQVPYPIVTRGLYCFLEYPLYSHIIAARVADTFPGMYISAGSVVRSILPVRSGNETLLLVGGGSHVPGAGSSEHRYRQLAEYAEQQLGLRSIDYRWKAYDYQGYDELPLIGKLYPWTNTTYVATGFLKWGLTNGTVAGMIISDTIQGKKNHWAPVFNSNRLSPLVAIPSAAVKVAKLTLS